MKAIKSLVAAIVLILAFSSSVWALPESWKVEGTGPDFMTIVKDSPNIVFAQVTRVTKQTLYVSVTKALKGKAQGEVRITDLHKRSFMNVPNLKDVFANGEDYFFFLNDVMVGTVPFKPAKGSVVLKVNKGKIVTSVISPKFTSDYGHEFEFKLMDKYFLNLVKVARGQAPDPDFLGMLYDKLQSSLKNPDDKMAASYLTMMLQLSPKYDDSEILFQLTKSSDVNARALALITLTGLVVAEKKAPTQQKAKAKGKKKKGSAGDTAKQLFDRSMEMLFGDRAFLCQSLAAKSLAMQQNKKAIEILAGMIDRAGMQPVEKCELFPAMGIEVPKKAIMRAITEFDSDEALDVLERELRKNKVDTFRLILEIFREYQDNGLNLLLLDLLQDSNFLPRQVAILEYFRAIKSDETIQDLKDLYVSPDAGKFIRKSIIEVFEDYRDPKQTVDFLVAQAMRDESPVVRQAGARALGKLEAPEFVQVVRDIYFKESNRLAREFYVEALSQVKTRDAYECLKWLKTKETDRRMLKQIQFAMKKSQYLSQ